jgi:hypothetical protein
MNAAGRLTEAVVAWLATLDADQQQRATFAFDDPERFVWAYTPGERAGLALRDMRPGQRAAAAGIVAAAMSERGAREVGDIIALESILGAVERDAGSSMWRRRDPELYWFAAFGDPASDKPWSWRIGGHHIAIGTTVGNGRILGTTPSFLGANPAVVPDGPRVGFRALTGEETLARELLLALSTDARKVAIVDSVAPPDIASGNGARADLRSVPSGIRYDHLEPDGRARCETLIRHYLQRATPEVATADWGRLAASGLEATTFAWAGPAEPGRGHYYAIRSEHFLVEYDNTQNGANHIHAVWRDLANDWGEDALAAHYRRAHRNPT